MAFIFFTTNVVLSCTANLLHNYSEKYSIFQLTDELTNLKNVSGRAVAASLINDKLLETLQLHREKVNFHAFEYKKGLSPLVKTSK